MPEADENGACGANSTRVFFEPNGGGQPHIRCAPIMKVQSAGIYTFAACYNYDCLPPSISQQLQGIYVERLLIPGGPTEPGENSTATAVTLLHEECAMPRVTGLAVNDNNQLVPLPVSEGEQGEFLLPAKGVAALNVRRSTNEGCDDDQYVAMVVTTNYIQGDQPVVPTSSCPCWTTPVNGECDGIKVPITLETLPDGYNNGTSYQQCIDPANFDFFQGRMAFSYCWRYKCLPNEFSSSDFTATVTQLDKFNIKRMPGNVVYNATLKGGVTYKGGDWVTTNITLPPRGLGNLTFVYTVPMGFDDLSAAVTMDIQPNQELPAQPPAPPGTICRCPDLPLSDGTCESDFTLLTRVTRNDTDGNQLETSLCLPVPQYDFFTQTFWFSTCWRWACLEESFRLPDSDTIKPYTITVPNIDRLNLDRMPGGNAQFELRKPREVDIRVRARSPDGDEEVGPFTEDSTVELPSSIGSFDISMDIPPQPWVDNNAAAVVITPIFGPTPPPAPISPPLPPAPPISPNNTRRVVLSTSVLEDVESLDQLERILRRKSAAMVAALTGYQLALPVGFRDYSVMEDCSAGSIEAMTVRLASILGVDASKVSVSCRYIGSNTVRRRRGLLQERTLLQGGLRQLCDGQALDMGVELDLDADSVQSRPDGLDGAISESSAKMLEQFGQDTCMGQAMKATKVRLEQPRFEALSTEAQCSSLRQSLSVPDFSVISQFCEEQDIELEDPSDIPPDGGPGGGDGSTSSDSLSDDDKVALGVGLGVGLGGGLLLIVGVLALYGTRKRSALDNLLGQKVSPNQGGPKPPRGSPAATYLENQDSRSSPLNAPPAAVWRGNAFAPGTAENGLNSFVYTPHLGGMHGLKLFTTQQCLNLRT
ncbi:hypothetical protein DUNSADRAFT_97 [Dunaliella salina]|uniref:Uncharacterized protein n=1 Tax=Dunaliella salina TaxID=3046 RepID=A0ABQ7H8X8_DUNSA|nr:hypothetical protein DUNSADRAFT_97 [Dunaliella salina]|eukprot:KAF5843295.1 hypothetical protein DUNSADRAFT_97 [Dunaliella salina]